MKLLRFRYNWKRFSGEPNYGFVLRNADENLEASTEKMCMTTYENPTLVLTYY